MKLLKIVILCALVAPTIHAEESAPFSYTASFSGEYDFPPIAGIALGPVIRFSYEPAPPIRLEASIAARRFLAWEFSGEVGACWLLYRQGAWLPGVGIALAASYGSWSTVETWNTPATSTWPVGPYWTFGGGLTIAPLDFHFPSFDISFLRTTAGWRFGGERNAPYLGCELLGLRMPIGGL